MQIKPPQDEPKYALWGAYSTLKLFAFVVTIFLWFEIVANRLIYRFVPALYLIDEAGSSDLPGASADWMTYPSNLYIPEFLFVSIVLCGIPLAVFGSQREESRVKLISGSGGALFMGAISLTFLLLGIVALLVNGLGYWEEIRAQNFAFTFPPDGRAKYHFTISFWPMTLMMAAGILMVLHRFSIRLPAYELRRFIFSTTFRVSASLTVFCFIIFFLDTAANLVEIKHSTPYFELFYFGHASQHGYYATLAWSMSVLIWSWACRLALERWKHRYEQRTDFAMCDICGYDVRGTINNDPPACPECGAVVPQDKAKIIRRQMKPQLAESAANLH